ncbi:MAG: TIGR00730 family Rossman fold protein [Bacteroidales bacterium]|nr:TIGR00730 family Rossman fold protein [Bacteroidales bacterium]
MINNICVFCSSSDVIDKVYNDNALELAELIIKEGMQLVNGGSKVGLMGIMARRVKELGGSSIGIIPQLIYDKGLACYSTENLIITKDMRERKEKLSAYADAFIALPGGFGTLEELLEVMTLKQLEVHQKPIVIMNINGFYNQLLKQFEVFYENNFARSDYKRLYYTAHTAKEAIGYIKNYRYEKLESKWYKDNLNL